MLQGELFRGNCLEGKSLGGNCPGGSFIRGNSLWARSPGVNCPRGNFMGWGVVVRGVVVQRGIIKG